MPFTQRRKSSPREKKTFVLLILLLYGSWQGDMFECWLCTFMLKRQLWFFKTLPGIASRSRFFNLSPTASQETTGENVKRVLNGISVACLLKVVNC